MAAPDADSLAPADFLDLDGFAHRPLFDSCEFVWDALKRLADYVRDNLRPAIEGTVMPGAWVGEQVQIGPGTVVETGAMIIGPAIIGRDCRLRGGAYVRENVVAGDRVVIGHASEVKGSILLDTAQAPHFNYVGDSILGRETNLGAGTILSNLKVTDDQVIVECDGRRLATGMRKFGAVVGDGVQTGCNAVLNPGTLIGKGTLIYPCCSLRGVIPAHSVVKLRQEVTCVERRR
jgi:NDP-sugar pyrophosphorylase family protein